MADEDPTLEGVRMVSLAGSEATSVFLPGPTVWPNAKIVRAHQHAFELRARINTWLALEPMKPEALIHDDRMGWSLRLKVKQPPPLDDWALIVGDVIHNLRSALDAVVWSLSSVEDGDAGSGGVQFPIVLDSAKWNDQARVRLRGVMSEYVERIRSLQPLNQGEAERLTNGLFVLHRLDIDDKHRAGLNASVAFDSAQLDGRIEFESDEAAERNSPPRQELYEPELVDGAILMETTTTDPIKSVSGGFNLEMVLRLATPAGPMRLFETLEELGAAVERSIIHVLHGASDGVPHAKQAYPTS